MAHHRFFAGIRLFPHDAGKGGEGIGKAVVAIDAGNLFDQVDFAFEIEAPAGQVYLVFAFPGLLQGAAQGLQY